MPAINLSNIKRKILGKPKNWAAGLEASTLPLCYAAPKTLTFFNSVLRSNPANPENGKIDMRGLDVNPEAK